MRTEKIKAKTRVLEELLKIQPDSKIEKLFKKDPEPKKEKEVKSHKLPKSQERIFKPKKHDFL
ncbi:hypothetical protein [Pollutibacter soli]|uniref:hypothetical protein n=1 Tax=Pollutibacter soli TaxID=3034157 RepID=UPI003013A691